jgi:hypothetical protein
MDEGPSSFLYERSALQAKEVAESGSGLLARVERKPHAHISSRFKPAFRARAKSSGKGSTRVTMPALVEPKTKPSGTQTSSESASQSAAPLSPGSATSQVDSISAQTPWNISPLTVSRTRLQTRGRKTL